MIAGEAGDEQADQRQRDRSAILADELHGRSPYQTRQQTFAEVADAAADGDRDDEAARR